MTFRYLLPAALLLSASATAHAQLDITLTTTPTPNDGITQFAPANALAVWVEDEAGNFVRTIDRKSAVRTIHLVAWGNASGGAGVDMDAVSGATRLNHLTPVTLSWDLTGRNGAQVADGTYTVRMETADENSVDAATNNQGTFTFTKGGAEELQGPLTNGGFENVTISFAPLPDQVGIDPNQPQVVTGGCQASGQGGDLVWALLLLGLILWFARGALGAGLVAPVRSRGAGHIRHRHR